MLVKQTANINFSQGVDTKTDEKQIPLGRFLALDNSVFTKAGLLQKRNGFGNLGALPTTEFTYATTFNGNLVATGNRLAAYSSGSNSWVDKGHIQQVNVDTLPLLRSSLNQTQADAAVSDNNLVCTVYTETGGSVSPVYKYAVADATTGQNIVAPTLIPGGLGVVTGSPRVFFMGNYFVIVFSNNFTGTYHLQYISINVRNPALITAAADITTQYTPSSGVDWDGFVANQALYLAWNGSDGGGAIRMLYLTSHLEASTVKVFTGKSATILSVCADIMGGTPVIYVSFYTSGTTSTYTLAVNQALTTILAPTLLDNAHSYSAITSAAQNGSVIVYVEALNNYSYDSAIPTHFINYITCTSAGVVGTPTVLIRSVGLGSKAVIVGGVVYMLVAYSSPYQPSYFLIDGSANIIGKLAYSNGGGYLATGLPSVSVDEDILSIAYLLKDTITPTNKTQSASNSGLPIYSQLGINLAKFEITTSGVVSAEIGSNLNLSGGLLWMYDGYTICENNFNVWPDSIEATWSATGGNIHAQPDGATNTNAYFYVVTYEWSDNQGNVFRSAPSIPISVTTTGSGVIGSITINVPTLRLTSKTPPIKIVIYRWSIAQQIYYRVTSSSSPLLNNTAVDSVSYTDTLADSSIVGNNILYTTGGVVENIGPPATSSIAMFKSRLFLVDAEDKNLLWFSKQVIENTPVEMSDLFTIFVAPTTAAQGNTGPITALSAMDDKLIIFKKDAIYYITGNGPDNTGAQNDFSDPIFITATVGSANQRSIVFIPNGLMFQSDKGIWLLGRDLSTQYIGAPVEAYNSATVLSAINVPGTNQVRFTLDNGKTLMYDYFYGQWGTFSGISGVSSTLYQNLHTFINSFGSALQETPGVYVDGSNPTLLSLTTSWFNLTGLQGYQRAYFFYLLGTYFSPHKINLQIAYDYNSSPTQSVIITPDNFAPNYGDSSPYGEPNPYGGVGDIEQWRVFLTTQRCQSFQITLNEVYDATLGVVAGQGLSLSGINLVYAQKSGFVPMSNARSVGR